MSYASDTDDMEQCCQGAEHGKGLSDFERMCEYFGYSTSEFSMLSQNEQANYRWNWKTFGSK